MSEVTTEAAAQATTPAATEVKTESKVETAAEVKTDAAATPEVKVEEKKDEPKAEEKVAPEKYDLKLAEGSLLDVSALGRIEAFAKQQGLSNEEAQALVDKQQAEVATFVEDRKVMWHKQASEDKDIGGENFAKNAELAKRAFERVAPEGLKAEMDRTGYGNHPLVLKMFVNLGRMMADDKFVQGGQAAAASKSAAELLYGTTKP